MNNKKHRTTMIILNVLLFISLIWTLIFKLPSVNADFSRFIHSNPILDTIENAYWNGGFLIPFPISIANVIYSIMCLHSTYKSQRPNYKQTVEYLTYTIISLFALVIHCITFNYIIECIIAG